VNFSHPQSIAKPELLSPPARSLFSLAFIGYHVVMVPLLVIILVRILEGIFVAGSVGSVIVLILTGIEDLETLFGWETSHHS
jgi:hypothetical protein